MVRTAITNPSTSNNPVPAISLLSPSSVNTGSADLQLAVVGTNFVPGAVVQWNGADRTTTFFSSTQLTAYIPASDLAIPGTATITVINPTPAGGTSNTSSFSITTAYKATPVVTWISPASISYGTALSAIQLNAAASVPGTFIYTPAAGTVVGAGKQTLSVTFTPTDTTDYAAVTTTTSLVVAPAVPVLGWPAQRRSQPVRRFRRCNWMQPPQCRGRSYITRRAEQYCLWEHKRFRLPSHQRMALTMRRRPPVLPSPFSQSVKLCLY